MQIALSFIRRGTRGILTRDFKNLSRTAFPLLFVRVMQTSENETPATGKPAPAASPETWLAEHGDCLYRTALMRVRNPDIAADLVQDTLLAALRTLEKFGGRSSERT